MPSARGLRHVNGVVQKELVRLRLAFHQPRVQPLSDAATPDALTKHSLRAQLPFIGGKLQPDTMAVYDIAAGRQSIHLVHLYCGEVLLPPEYVAIIKGRLPRSAWLEPAALGSSFWRSGKGGAKDDELCATLRKAEVQAGRRTSRLDELARWSQEVGGFRIRLNWAMQLVPLGADRFAFLFRLPYEVIIFSGLWLRLKEGLSGVSVVKAAIAQLGYRGEPGKTKLQYPSLSVLAVPELLDALP